MIRARLLLLYALILQASADPIEIRLAPTDLTVSPDKLRINLLDPTVDVTATCMNEKPSGGKFPIDLKSGSPDTKNELQLSFEIPEKSRVFVNNTDVYPKFTIRFFAKTTDCNDADEDKVITIKAGNIRITSSAGINVKMVSETYSNIKLSKCGIVANLVFEGCGSGSLHGNVTFQSTYDPSHRFLRDVGQPLQFDYCRSYLSTDSGLPLQYGNLKQSNRRKLECERTPCGLCKSSGASIPRGLVAGSVAYLLALVLM
jgi:hypothetical protein